MGFTIWLIFARAVGTGFRCRALLLARERQVDGAIRYYYKYPVISLRKEAMIQSNEIQEIADVLGLEKDRSGFTALRFSAMIAHVSRWVRSSAFTVLWHRGIGDSRRWWSPSRRWFGAERRERR